MTKNNETIKIIERYFNDYELLLKLANKNDQFNINKLNRCLNKILCYYLATQDKTYYSAVEEVFSLYEQLGEQKITPMFLDEVMEEGYVTHSFLEQEKEYITKYGFNYQRHLLESEKALITRMQSNLAELEKLHKCRFMDLREEHSTILPEEELYLTIPGTKTIHYAENSPERFYSGPIMISSFDDFPIIQGESKTDYLLRIFVYNCETLYNGRPDLSADEVIKTIEYFSSPTNIAFINMSSLKDKTISSIIYNPHDTNHLKNYRRFLLDQKMPIKNYFTIEQSDAPEKFEVGDLVVKREDISKENIDIIKFPDIYKLKQLYAKENGIKDGELFDFFDCTTDYEMEEPIKKYYRV